MTDPLRFKSDLLDTVYCAPGASTADYDAAFLLLIKSIRPVEGFPVAPVTLPVLCVSEHVKTEEIEYKRHALTLAG